MSPQRRVFREYDPEHPTTRYALGVLDDRILAGELVRAACRRHVDDLGASSYGDSQLWFDEQQALDVFRFFEQLRHWKGAMAGGPCLQCDTTGLLPGGVTCNVCEGAGSVEARPFALELWQCFIVGSIFGWKRPDGLRRFRSGYVETGKGNGKTLLASGVAGQLAFLDGEAGAEVYCAATKLDQARLVFSDCTNTLRASRFAESLQFYKTSIYDPAGHGRITPLGADKSTTDGINPHGAIVDELHAHKTGGLLQVIRKSMVKRRQPFMFMITNSGYDKKTVCWRHHEYGTKVNAGLVHDDTFFCYIAAVDDSDNPLEDMACLPKANPNLGVSVSIEELRKEQRLAREMPEEAADFLRYHAGRWVWGAKRAIRDDVWNDQAKRTPLKLLKGRPCWGGLDLAQSWDINAFVLAFPDDEPTEVPQGEGEPLLVTGVDLLAWFWCPEGTVLDRAKKGDGFYQAWVDQGVLLTTPGKTTDYDYIERTVAKLAEQFDIQTIGYDPHNANQTAIHLQDDHGLELVRFSQGFGMMAAPVKRMMELIVARQFRHGGHPVLGWMASCVELKGNEYGEKRIIKPEGTGHTGEENTGGPKVDGMVAAAMGLGAYLIQEAAEEEDTTSVYDTDARADGLRRV